MISGRSILIASASALAILGIGGCVSTPFQSTPSVVNAQANFGHYKLAKGRVQLSISRSKASPIDYTFTVTPLISGDPNASYYFHYDENSNASDNISVKRDRGGVLTSVSVNATDNVGDIFTAAAKFVVAVPTVTSSGVGSFATMSGTTAPTACSNPGVQTSVHRIIDPHTKNVINVGKALGFRDDGCVVVSLIPAKSNTSSSENGCTTFNNKPSGILYRPLREHNLTVKIDGNIVLQSSVMLPDEGTRTLGCIPVERYALVNTQLSVKFDAGAPTEVTLNKPSSTLAGMRLPLTIAEEILAVPASLLSLKVNNVSQETELLKAQLALEEARINATTNSDD